MSDDMKPNPLQNLKAVAHMAEVSGLHIDDLRVMPAAGVADIVYEAKDRIEELEAKLGLAVKRLDKIQSGYYGRAAAIARTTLAELKGETDE